MIMLSERGVVGAGDLRLGEPGPLFDQARETDPEVDVRDPLAALEVLDLHKSRPTMPTPAAAEKQRGV